MQLYEGSIKLWKINKSFGFIQPNGGGKDVFVHIRDLKHSNYQPQIGDNVCFKIVADKDGEIRAYDAFIKGQEITRQQIKTKSFDNNQAQVREYRLGMLPILLIAMIPLVSSALLIKQPNLGGLWNLEVVCNTVFRLLMHNAESCHIYTKLHIPTPAQKFIPFFVYLFFSLVTFTVYAVDKIKTHRDEWRVSEKTLHLLELLGGWPGALIAQCTIRHKNKKHLFKSFFG
ncbi:MAG: cold shock and DUF1294 domain-containing protein [Proteobacteria bacterium]|nr:cold shock and DUF1294 domain-containing protein [Pseudomonadota bacterium]